MMQTEGGAQVLHHSSDEEMKDEYDYDQHVPATSNPVQPNQSHSNTQNANFNQSQQSTTPT